LSESYLKFDRPYRRGVVLGLSLAETFLILLFLLLLATIGILTFLEEEKERLREELERNESILVAIEEAMGPNPSPEDFRVLIEALAHQRDLEQKIGELEKLEYLRALYEEIEKRNLSEPEKENIAEHLADIVRNFSSEHLADISELLKDFSQQEKSPIDYEKEISRLKEAIAQLESSVPPGVMPSCWQKERDSIVNNKKYIEQYIYDVLMFDDGVIVERRGRPTDPEILGNVENEPSISDGAFGRKLSFGEYNNLFLPLTEAGENKLIRDYSCKYYVYMFDKTTSKQNYKISLNKLERNFLRYEASINERWPHESF
jgi:hypothetical protein